MELEIIRESWCDSDQAKGLTLLLVDLHSTVEGKRQKWKYSTNLIVVKSEVLKYLTSCCFSFSFAIFNFLRSQTTNHEIEVTNF
jgi:hypothetical protein